ncbi:RNA polymerase sigma factor [Nocardia gipuzkoensis]
MRFRRAKPTGRGQFEALYRQHHDHVYRYMMTATRGDTQRAEDLTQEAFLRVWRTYGPQAGDQAEALLITTAKNCLVDVWRKDSRLVFWESYVETDVPVDGWTNASADQFERVLDSKVIEQIFDEAAKRLTDGEWRVVFMGWVMGKTDAEIAEELGTTAKTVKTLRCSARRKIKACASRDGYEITFSDVGRTDRSGSTPGIGEVTV